MGGVTHTNREALPVPGAVGDFASHTNVMGGPGAPRVCWGGGQEPRSWSATKMSAPLPGAARAVWAHGRPVDQVTYICVVHREHGWHEVHLKEKMATH